MAKPSFKELKQQVDGIYQRYDGHFAGKPRATRDLDLLEELIEELTEVVEVAKSSMNGGRDPAMISLLEMAQQNLEVYQGEHSAIVSAQAMGPTSVMAARVVMEANLTFGRYYRHFARRERRTRDLGLMEELIEELEGVERRMKAVAEEEGEELAANLEVVSSNLEMYRREEAAIRSARQEGSAQERADLMATLANDQFALYRGHFAGKARHTRRAELLRRIIKQLEEIRSVMRELKRRGLHSSANDRNMRIVTENLKVYKQEVREITKAKSGLTTDQIAGSLGGAANDIMAVYRADFAGQDRATRDLDQLSLLCDQMAEIALQMRAIDEEEPSEMNSKNLDIVLDAWMLYDSEYRRVVEAKAEAQV